MCNWPQAAVWDGCSRLAVSCCAFVYQHPSMHRLMWPSAAEPAVVRQNQTHSTAVVAQSLPTVPSKPTFSATFTATYYCIKNIVFSSDYMGEPKYLTKCSVRCDVNRAFVKPKPSFYQKVNVRYPCLLLHSHPVVCFCCRVQRDCCPSLYQSSPVSRCRCCCWFDCPGCARLTQVYPDWTVVAAVVPLPGCATDQPAASELVDDDVLLKVTNYKSERLIMIKIINQND